MALSPIYKFTGGLLAVSALVACYPTPPAGSAAVAQAQFVPIPIYFFRQAEEQPQTRSTVVDEAGATPQKKFFPFPLPFPLPIFVPFPKPILGFLGYDDKKPAASVPVIVSSNQKPQDPQIIIVPPQPSRPTPCCIPVQPGGQPDDPQNNPRPRPQPQPGSEPRPRPQPGSEPKPKPQPTPQPDPVPDRPGKLESNQESSMDMTDGVEDAEDHHHHEHFDDQQKELSEEDYQLVHHEGEDPAEHLKHARHHQR